MPPCLQKITADFSIMELVLQLRRQRPAAVQTKVCVFTGTHNQNIHDNMEHTR